LRVLSDISEARRQEDPELIEKLEQGESSQAKKADWERVRDLTEKVLAEQSKDLWVAAWLTESLIYLEQIAGLTQGLNLIDRLLTNFWDSLYPQLEDDDPELRIAPLSWLGSYFDPAKSSSPVLAVRTVAAQWLDYEREQKLQGSAWESTPRDFYENRRETLNECLNSLSVLEQTCEEKFPKEKFADERPTFTILRGELERIETSLRTLLGNEPAPAPDPITQSGDELSAAVNVGERTSSIPLTTEAIQTRTDAIAHITACARFLMRADPKDPIPYLLMRALRWGELRAAQNGQVANLLEAPPTGLRMAIKQLAQAGKWAKLIESAEDAMCSGYGRGWLDLQRYAIDACEKLGYDAAAKALRSELRTLLSDIADLTKQTLLDDTGTANPDTLAWLQQENLSS
jgi:type VI secretion system protein ImpA